MAPAMKDTSKRTYSPAAAQPFMALSPIRLSVLVRLVMKRSQVRYVPPFTAPAARARDNQLGP